MIWLGRFSTSPLNPRAASYNSNDLRAINRIRIINDREYDVHISGPF